MKSMPFPLEQGWDEEIIKILKRLGSLKVVYPSELLAARRAAFVRQVEQAQSWTANNVVADEQFLQYLENLKSISMEYPLALRAARRAAFVDQIRQYSRVEIAEELSSKDQEIIKLLRGLKSVEAEYPPALLAARRAAFRRQIKLGGGVSVLEALRASIRNLFLRNAKTFPAPTMSMMRTSFVVMILLLAVFVGSLLGNPAQSINSPSQSEVAQPGSISVATSTSAVAKVICKPGYLPPLCLMKEFDKSHDLTFPGNGLARPAVAKDTLPGNSGVYKAAYVNDGLYGPGTTWISNSAYSWIKIDLGKPTTVNTVAFGRDRLGEFNDHNPGQFVIAVALSDNIYADGNSSNDYVEYTDVFNSEQAGFNGVISGPETIQAHFKPVSARFIKITFANKGTAIDEVEAFMIRPTDLGNGPTKPPKEGLPGISSTSIPTSTSVPTEIATPVPTNTPVPADTATPVPTNTPAPTDTAIPAPTDTPVPPTDTAIPAPTDTPVPPTDTEVPFVPTDTPIPLQANLPQPTDTSIPPITLIEPMIVPTGTPGLAAGS